MASATDVLKTLGLTGGSAKSTSQQMTGVGVLDIAKKAGISAKEGLKELGEALTTEKYKEFGPVKYGHKLAPKSEEEAIRSGLVKLPGSKTYIDISFSSPLLKVSSPAQKIINEYAKKISTEVSEKARKPLGTLFSDFYRRVFDRFNPIVSLVRQAQKAGVEIPMGQNPELLARRYLGIKGISEAKLGWKTFDLTPEGNIKITGEGLGEILEPMKSKLDDLRVLMTAEREIELSKRGIEEGIDINQSHQLLNALKQKHGEKYADLETAATAVRNFTRRAILDPLKDIGAMSSDTYRRITETNEFYAPFQRVMDELESYGTVGGTQGQFQAKFNPLKKIKGSERQIIDPLESIITNVYKITDFVEKARVAKSIVNLRNLSKEFDNVITKVSPKMVPVATIKTAEDLIETVFRPSFFNPGKDTIAVLEDGKRVFYKVPEDLADLVNNFTPGDTNIFTKILQFPAKTLRAGATLSPEFIGRNPFRDQFTAMVQSKYGFTPGVDLVKGTWELIGRKDVYNKWLASGGAQSMLVSLDRVSSQKTLQQIMVKGAIEKTKRGMIATVKNPLDVLRIISETGEGATRLGVFKKALKKGTSDIEAAFESRESTLDFARMGSNVRGLNQITAFLNARLQGLDKIVRAFKQRPVATTAKVVSGITVPSILLYLNNRDDPRWKEIPRWQKDLFWIIFTDNHILRIPKPFELGIVFGSVPERILEWVDENDPDALRSVMQTMAQDLTLGSILPTGLVPIIENTTNYDFFTQRPIVSQSIEGLPPELQSQPFTAETAKLIGKYAKTSPAKIENMFLGYTGGLGRYALSISDSVLKKSGISNPPPLPAKTLADTPAIRAFVVREPIGSASESVNGFFELLEEAESWERAARDAAERGDSATTQRIFEEHKEIFLAKGLRKTAKDMSQLRNLKDAIYESRELNPQEKRERIDSIDRMITQMAIQSLEFSDSVLTQ